MAKLGETLTTTDVEVEGESAQPLGGVLSTKNIRIASGSYSLLGSMLSTEELWAGGDEMGYWNPSREPPLILPSSLNQTSVTYGVNAWGNWAQVEAATAVDMVLAQLVGTKVVIESCTWWVQIGVGAAESEVVIAEVGSASFVSGSGAYPVLAFVCRLAPVLIAAGTRVSVRGYLTQTAISNRTGRLYLACLPTPAAWEATWPDTYIEGSRVSSFYRQPATPAYTALTSSGWTELIASAASDMLIDGAQASTGAASHETGQTLQFAVGAAGSEVMIAEIPFPNIGVVAYLVGAVPTVRKAIVYAGERVSAKWGKTIAGSPTAAFYFETLT